MRKDDKRADANGSGEEDWRVYLRTSMHPSREDIIFVSLNFRYIDLPSSRSSLVQSWSGQIKESKMSDSQNGQNPEFGQKTTQLIYTTTYYDFVR